MLATKDICAHMEVRVFCIPSGANNRLRSTSSENESMSRKPRVRKRFDHSFLQWRNMGQSRSACIRLHSQDPRKQE